MSNIRGILLPRRSSVSLSKSNIFSLMTIMLRYITNKPECCFYKQNESGIYDTRLLHEILIEKIIFIVSPIQNLIAILRIGSTTK